MNDTLSGDDNPHENKQDTSNVVRWDMSEMHKEIKERANEILVFYHEKEKKQRQTHIHKTIKEIKSMLNDTPMADFRKSYLHHLLYYGLHFMLYDKQDLEKNLKQSIELIQYEKGMQL